MKSQVSSVRKNLKLHANGSFRGVLSVSLVEQLDQDMKLAMRNKDKFTLSVIRMVRSSIKYIEIEQGSALTDEQVIDVLTRELKQRRDSLQEFEKANRSDLSQNVRDEIVVLQKYLPKQLSEDELSEIVKETIAEIGAAKKSDMGKVMSALMPKVKGKADGKMVSKLVQDKLQ